MRLVVYATSYSISRRIDAIFDFSSVLRILKEFNVKELQEFPKQTHWCIESITVYLV